MRRRLVASLLALASLLSLAPAPVGAAGPPHAWLFGAWTGGLFPVPTTINAEVCLGQPTVIFTRDVVMRATLTDVTFIQRVIATARTSPGHTDFTFAPAPQPAADPNNPLRSLTAGEPATGFGCANPDVLPVQRKSDNEIVFPGCADFPNPLVRCPER